jgi:hypothetical protein
MKIFFYKNGIKKDISLNKAQSDSLSLNIKKLIEGIDDEARLVVDDERLDEIKKNDEAIEILFEKPVKFTSQEFSNYSIGKILIPVSGDLAGTENENGVVILLGEKIYDSSPYINTNGKELVNEIYRSSILN